MARNGSSTSLSEPIEETINSAEAQQTWRMERNSSILLDSSSPFHSSESCSVNGSVTISNVPKFVSPELQLIGKLVLLEMKNVLGDEKKSFVFAGLISTVNADCLTLMFCLRYTKEDFENRSKMSLDDCSVESSPLRKDDHPAFLKFKSPLLPEETNVGLPAGRSAELRSIFSTVLYPQFPSLECTGKEALNEYCSIGPLRFVTLSRKKIQVIRFIQAAPDVSLLLFQHPADAILDRQCLRMLVRRYLVSVSIKKQSDATLTDFVTRIGDFQYTRDIDLEEMAREELAELTRVDSNMKEKLRIVRQSRNDGGDVLEQHERDVIMRVILKSTLAPGITYFIALLEALISIAALGFTLLHLFIGRDVVVRFTHANVFQIIWGWFVGLVAAMFTYHHASAMAPPLKSQLLYCSIRTITVACGFTICTVMGSSMLVFLVQDLRPWMESMGGRNQREIEANIKGFQRLCYPLLCFYILLSLALIGDLVGLGYAALKMRTIDMMIARGGTVVI